MALEALISSLISTERPDMTISFAVSSGFLVHINGAISYNRRFNELLHLMNKLHFISGLPRSGSTLLSAIFNQNPEFHAAMSSPVASLMNATLEMTGAGSEF